MPEDALNGHRPGLKPRLNGCLSRMQGNLHVRFGVGAGVKLPRPHHAAKQEGQLAEVSTTEWSCAERLKAPGVSE